ncbi:MAG: glycosyltransferase family 2 protein [Alphaproteobacteria bacterium]|jgi:glycosyltransferase involved in cell wall biosynthesis|nr:glycosyltransferase family 2 protein [Alphaproteobacteria bacterium]
MSPINVSVFVLTKNEESNITHCLDSLQEYKEIFVIDSNSMDNTVELAKSYNNVNVINFNWNGQYPKKKQWAIDNIDISTKWILFVDADEELSQKLNSEIKTAINKDYNAFYATADVWFMNKKMRFGRKHKKIILLKKGFVNFPIIDDLNVAEMWEVEGHYQPIVIGKIASLKNKYNHNDKKPLYAMIDRHNRYSSWQAEVQNQIYGSGLRGFIKKLYHNLPFMPLITFLDSYIFKFGFLDGKTGYNYAIFRAYYYWQTKLKKTS